MVTIYSCKDAPQYFALMVGERGAIVGSVMIWPGFNKLEDDVFATLCAKYPEHFAENDPGPEAIFRPNAEKIRRSTTDHFLKDGWSFERQIDEKDARELWGADIGLEFGLLCNVVYFENSDGSGGKNILHGVTLQHRDRPGCLYIGLAGKLIAELNFAKEEHKISWLMKPADWLALCKVNAPVSHAS